MQVDVNINNNHSNKSSYQQSSARLKTRMAQSGKELLDGQ